MVVITVVDCNDVKFVINFYMYTWGHVGIYGFYGCCVVRVIVLNENI